MKRITKWICVTSCAILAAVILYFAFAFFGNPLAWTIARINTGRYMDENLADSHFQINKVGYNFKTGGYYAYIDSLTSPDSYFTIYFDGWGRYRYDSYENIINGHNTYSRINQQYWDLVKNGFPYDNGQFDVSIVYGEIKAKGIYGIYSYTDENGNLIEYTLDKEYGLDRSTLVLDAEYDILQLGMEAGRICLYIHDPIITVERAAELLLEVKLFMDSRGIPCHAIDFNLCEPRNEEGQIIGDQITLFEFLYSDIYEEGLVDRVQAHWDIAREHFAIQDKNNAKFFEEQSANQ